ncbi:hypothetical protein ASC78_20855 [Variovorax sp. Root318D1]|uniref:hypothetical protein n=1 Tax=Variovorax sp. Root318D1 TaxID=1736513 RepID=UPI0006FA17CC|nr:hypothetical protein [Variovorax sp. Root318D1]KQU89637.1 hypothetical protein ASC78_20855 [Variovorax sp. Root318D1]
MAKLRDFMTENTPVLLPLTLQASSASSTQQLIEIETRLRNEARPSDFSSAPNWRHSSEIDARCERDAIHERFDFGAYFFCEQRGVSILKIEAMLGLAKLVRRQ